MKIRINKNSEFSFLTVSIVILAVAMNILLTLLFNGAYIDLTADKRYSLSKESKEFLQQNQMPVSIRFYVGKDLNNKNAVLGQYADYLRKLFIEYKNNSHGLINLSFVEVVPFANTQAEAEKAGVKEFDVAEGSQYIYLGASFTNGEGKTLSIPRFLPEGRKTIEDDISRLLAVLANKDKKTIGIMSPFFRVIESNNPMEYAKDGELVSKLKTSGYNVVSLREDTPFVPRNIDAVIVLYPLDLDIIGVFALDQYLLRGGKVMVLLDAFAEERYRNNPQYSTYSSGMQKMLQKNGVKYHENILTGDNINSRELVLEGHKIRYPLWLAINKEQMADHPIMKGINKLYLNHAGSFEILPVNDMKTVNLFTTGEKSGLLEAEVVADLGYDNLLKNYVLTDAKHVLAVLREGKFEPSFNQSIVADQNLLAKMPTFLTIPLAEGKLLAVGDSDMAFSLLQYDDKLQNDNWRFLRNAVDYLTESGLISVGVKETAKSINNLGDVFYQKANEIYKEQKLKASEELMDIRQRILSAQEKNSGISSIKLAKELEQLKREELIKDQEVRSISYKIKEKYERLLLEFSILIMFVLPMLSVLIVGGIYYWYSRRINSQAGKYI